MIKIPLPESIKAIQDLSKVPKILEKNIIHIKTLLERETRIFRKKIEREIKDRQFIYNLVGKRKRGEAKERFFVFVFSLLLPLSHSKKFPSSPRP